MNTPISAPTPVSRLTSERCHGIGYDETATIATANKNLTQVGMRFHHGQRSAPCRNGTLRRFSFCIEQHGDPAAMNDFTTDFDDVSRRPFAGVRATFNLVWLRRHNESFSLHLGHLRSNEVKSALKTDAKTACISSIREFVVSGYNRATFILAIAGNHQEMSAEQG
jgi:hypothetical protein